LRDAAIVVRSSGGLRTARPTHCTDCLWELVLKVQKKATANKVNLDIELENPGYFKPE
jgi:hypothetical protein